MKIRVLGCSGGIGGRHLRTTSLLVDHDILIDAGTGVEELSLAELKAIDHVFITHSHLDHIASLPMMVDTVGETRQKPLTVHATAPTIEILRKHIFNWLIWPDFTVIPDDQSPFMRFSTISLDETLVFDQRRITVLPAEHTVPAVGYLLESGAASIAFTGDTGVNPSLWPRLNAVKHLKTLIIETAFPDAQRELALASKHLCPSMLAAELANLHHYPEVFITHLKPGRIEETMTEVETVAAAYQPRMLQNNQIFDI
jgi:cAMP phosphodiesterase